MAFPTRTPAPVTSATRRSRRSRRAPRSGSHCVSSRCARWFATRAATNRKSESRFR